MNHDNAATMLTEGGNNITDRTELVVTAAPSAADETGSDRVEQRLAAMLDAKQQTAGGATDAVPAEDVEPDPDLTRAMIAAAEKQGADPSQNRVRLLITGLVRQFQTGVKTLL